jgi:hypothetical protein
MSKLSPICFIAGSFVLIVGFQNCSKTAFSKDVSASAFKSGGQVATGDDIPVGGVVSEVGDDAPAGGGSVDGEDGPETGDIAGEDGPETEDQDTKDDSDWLYIPGGRGHVPMSSVAICPADSKDAGKQKCPFFCFEGVDYTMHKSLARDYFAKHFDRSPDYGGGAVPGTCANPDLKTKR